MNQHTEPQAAQLKPCPFCGGDALYEQDRSESPKNLRWSAGCRVETCMGYMGPTFPRRKDAAEAWNRRAPDAEAAERIAALEKSLKIAELQNRGTLANNLCSDHRDKQIGKPCLACTIETLTRERDAALRDAEHLRGLLLAMLMHAKPIGDGQDESIVPTIHLRVAGKELQDAARSGERGEGSNG